LVVACGGSGRHVAAQPAPTAASYPGLTYGGVAVGLWDAAAPGEPLGERLDGVRGLGADAVLLPVFWKQHDVHDVDLHADPSVTTSDDLLRGLIRDAHARHLKVFLFPVVHLEVIKLGEWRGTMAPADVDAWWQAYRGFVLHYAALAEEEHVELLSVGSELGATEHWRDRWYALIGEVRRGYHGELTYSANWDHYREVSFWEPLDDVGVSSYGPIAASGDAAQDELDRAWQRTRDELDAFAAAQQKPLVITELGYPSRDGAAAAPWDYTRGGAIDLDEQRACFTAFATAFDGDRALRGVFVWIWWGAGGPSDGGYTPRGKPAEAVIRAMFAAPRALR
jgi:hypothetical protein